MKGEGSGIEDERDEGGEWKRGKGRRVEEGEKRVEDDSQMHLLSVEGYGCCIYH